MRDICTDCDSEQGLRTIYIYIYIYIYTYILYNLIKRNNFSLKYLQFY
jgi:hypothetical protein